MIMLKLIILHLPQFYFLNKLYPYYTAIDKNLIYKMNEYDDFVEVNN